MSQGESSAELLRSVNHTLILFGAMMSAVIFWAVFRPARESLLTVTGAMLTAGAAYDIQDFAQRTKLIFTTVLFAGAFQFMTGILVQEKGLRLMTLVPMLFIVLRLISHRRSAGIVLVAGLLSMSAAGGFRNSMAIFIEMMISGFFAWCVTMIVPWIHRPDTWTPANDGGFTTAETVRILLAAVIGTYISEALILPEGAWIAGTVAFLYMNKPRAGFGMIPLLRILGTILGMIAGSLFLSALSYMNYVMIYLVPVIGGFSFFILYSLKNYLLYSTLFMMSFCLYSDFLLPQTRNIFLLQLTTSRIICTVIGVFLTIMLEAFVLPEPNGEIKNEKTV